MSTPRLEAFLARLYTDREFLEQFLADPHGEALRAGLSPEEAASVAKVDAEALNIAARGFARKRETMSARPPRTFLSTMPRIIAALFRSLR